MAFKRQSKVSAEFSMSSLTDIIFLLLIFFMLTSQVVKIDPFELPVSDSKTVAATSVVVSISAAGQWKLNGVPLERAAMAGAVARKIREAEERDQVTVTIVAERGVPFTSVEGVMKIAAENRVKAMIATQPTT